MSERMYQVTCVRERVIYLLLFKEVITLQLMPK
jgi:hypothetical protein